MSEQEIKILKWEEQMQILLGDYWNSLYPHEKLMEIAYYEKRLKDYEYILSQNIKYLKSIKKYKLAKEWEKLLKETKNTLPFATAGHDPNSAE